jgi:biotin carboxyl carrier protein
VVAGDVVLVIEAMKMQHEIVAPAAGAVTQLLVDEGAQVDGRRLTLRVAIYGEDVYVNIPTGQLLFRAQPRFPRAEDEQAPGSLTSPVPGKVIRLACAVGEVVVAGDVVLVIEAMKMQHEIVAPAAGAVTQLLVDEGAQVDAGAVVAVIADPETEDL